MDIRKIKKLIDLMIESDLQAIEVKEGDQSIALTRRSPVVAAGAPVAMAAPVAPAPVIIFTTPGGRSASRIISASFNAVSGVVSAGFKTTVFPAAKAGAIFHAAISKGKFHGIICPATPNGLAEAPGTAYFTLSAHPA